MVMEVGCDVDDGQRLRSFGIDGDAAVEPFPDVVARCVQNRGDEWGDTSESVLLAIGSNR